MKTSSTPILPLPVVYQYSITDPTTFRDQTTVLSLIVSPLVLSQVFKYKVYTTTIYTVYILLEYYRYRVYSILVNFPCGSWRLLRPYAEANSDDQKHVVFPHHIPAPRVGHTNAARHHARMCVEPAGHGGRIAACKVRPFLHGLFECRPRRRCMERPWPMGVGLQKRGHVWSVCAQCR